MQPTGHTTSVQYDPLALMELWRDLERTKYPRALDLLTSDKNIYYLTPINLFLCKQGLFCQFQLPKKRNKIESQKKPKRNSHKLFRTLISGWSTCPNFGRAPPPPGPNFFIFIQFSGNIDWKIVWRPPLLLAPPGNPRSVTAFCSRNIYYVKGLSLLGLNQIIDLF